VNSVCLVGRLSRPPVVKFEGAGTQTASFTLAVEEPARSERTFTTYVGCTAWGKTAETCSLLNAADVVAIVGKLAWTKRTGKCGQEHSQLCVNVREVHVLQAAEGPNEPVGSRPAGW
jgi:single-stranded DNA-binding protein